MAKWQRFFCSVLFSPVFIFYFLFSRCSSRKNLKVNLFCPSAKFRNTVNAFFVHVTFDICDLFSGKKMRALLFISVKCWNFSSKNCILCPYVHFKFGLHIFYWLLCSWLMPLATLHFIFPHQSYVCKDGNSKALNSRGIFDLYRIIVEKVLDELAGQTETKISCQSEDSVCFIGAWYCPFYTTTWEISAIWLAESRGISA